MVAMIRWWLWLYLLPAVMVSIAETSPLAPELSALIQEAYHNNQELRSMEKNAEALRAEAPLAGSLQDPVVGFGLLNVPVDTYDLGQEQMTQKQLFASQKFPWFGTLDLRQQASELRALEAELQVHAKRLEVAKALADAWYDLGFTCQSLAVNNNLQTLVSQVLRVAESRYGTGKGLQQDVLAGQVQHSELIDEKIRLTTRERAVRAQIGSLLNRSAGFTEDAPLTLGEPKRLPDRTLLNKAALQTNPLIQEKMVAVDRAKVEVQLAEKAYLPDFDLRLSYGQREGLTDFVSATVAMTVPLYQATSQDSKLAAAEKRLLGAEKSLRGLKQTLPHTIGRVLAEIEGATENYDLFSEALSVQAANLADASLAAYSVGEVEFDTMLAARVRLLRIELQAENFKYLIYKKQAELEALIGTRLSSLEGLE